MTEFSQRDVPWMKSGVVVIDEAVTAAEAAELGGLNFDIELWGLQAVSPRDAESVDVRGRFAAVRTDTREALSVVGSHYHPLQYSEAFDFMDSINPRYVAAGVRRGGREGYIVVQAPESLRIDLIDGSDPHDLYLVLRTSHDGSKKVEAVVLPLRGKCTNMLSLRGFAFGAQHHWGVRHTVTMRDKLNEAQQTIMNLDHYVKDLQATAAALAEMDVELEEARRLFEWALPNRPKRDENVAEIMNLYQNSATNGFVGTGWGVVNAMSEWLDWGRKSKSADARFIGGLAGHGHKTINRVAGRLLSRER